MSLEKTANVERSLTEAEFLACGEEKLSDRESLFTVQTSPADYSRVLGFKGISCFSFNWHSRWITAESGSLSKTSHDPLSTDTSVTTTHSAAAGLSRTDEPSWIVLDEKTRREAKFELSGIRHDEADQCERRCILWFGLV